MSRLPLVFIITGMIGFAMFHAVSLSSLLGWLDAGVRGPEGWFNAHLFVLGWATMLAMGAFYQLIGVILQTNIHSEKLGWTHYAVFTVGLFGLLFGFALGKTAMIAFFAVLVLAGILLFAWNVGATMFGAAKWDAITLSAATAVLYLVLTGLTGMMMGVNFALGWWNGLHQRLFGAHIWLGAVGWFGLLITGFSYKMLPMFYLAHGHPTALQKAVPVLWNAAALAGAAAFLAEGGAAAVTPALAILAAAILMYNVHILQIRKHRHKKNPGAGIRWSMYGNHAFAAAAALALAWALANPQSLADTRTLLLAGWVYLPGWVSFMILCYAFKIVPFLWWTLKYGRRAGQPGTPLMANLLDEKKANALLAAVAVAFFLPAAGLALDLEPLVAAGGVLYSAVSLAYMALLGLVFTR